MFTLRIIEETRTNENAPFEQVISNYILGKAYSLLKNGATREFDDIMKNQYPDSDKDSVKSIICSDLGENFFVLKPTEEKVYFYFIMIENGVTFEKL